MVGDSLLANFCWILQIVWYVRGVCKGIKVLRILGFVIILICNIVLRGQISVFLKFVRIFLIINACF